MFSLNYGYQTSRSVYLDNSLQLQNSFIRKWNLRTVR